MSDPAPRIEIELPVDLDDSPSGSSFRAVSLNISESGMLVRSDQERVRGTTLRFTFAPFGGTATVIWTRQVVTNREGTQEEIRVLLGMKFLSMTRQDRKTLSRILQAPPSLSNA